MKNFYLYRYEDDSGVSGVGIVAQGVLFDNGKCVLSWLSKYKSIAVYESIDELEIIHGHHGHTKVIWEIEKES